MDGGAWGIDEGTRDGGGFPRTRHLMAGDPVGGMIEPDHRPEVIPEAVSHGPPAPRTVLKGNTPSPRRVIPRAPNGVLGGILPFSTE